MHVDDRLATVLDARADGDAAMRIQYRQLLDLVGTSPAQSRSDLLDAAHVRLGELARLIPPDERAAALAEPGVRLRNPRLVAELATDHPAVALAAVRAARLTEHQWLDLIPALPLSARGLMRHRRDLGPAVDARLAQLGIGDRGLPPVEPSAAIVAAAPATGTATAVSPSAVSPSNVHQLPPREEVLPAASGEPGGIGAIVKRIEAFRRNREASEAPRPANDSPRLPLGEQEPAAASLTAFDFATDNVGRISWSASPVAGMLIGLLLPMVEEPASGQARAGIPGAFRRRQPIRAAHIVIDGAPAIAGEWQIDAAPDFDTAGQFTGYIGRFRRPPPRAAAAAATNTEADRIRQVLHELRTPVNAIQGFAELIQQQLFGATPHEYRALAAGIAGDAARMLAGFEELDRLARLDSGSLTLEPGTCDLAMIVAGIVHQLEAFTGARGSGFAFDVPQGAYAVALSGEEAEHLVWRLLATLAGAARPGESLALALRPEGQAIRLTARLPEALNTVDDLFDAAPPQAPQAISAGIFGSGFTLRLAAAVARAAGGRFTRAGAEVILELPAAAAHDLTANPGVHSPYDAMESTTG
ncbi:MAG: HAMP domain-containing histidine kinase [Sphingomonadales bacterium]|nr:HAMP domain-containing histidine kinase [Sphingomonadales bacterium]